MSDNTSPQPGYLSNAELANRVESMVARYNKHLDQEVALLTQPDGNVTVTNVAGEDVSLPSYPGVIKGASQALDDINGVLPRAQAAQQAAETAATAAAASAQAATDKASAASNAAQQSEQGAAAASSSAAAAAGSADTAHASAASATDAATGAQTSSTQAQQHAQVASDASSAAQDALTAGQAARDKAQAWATNPPGQAVEAGQYSALHWAEQARLATAGAMVFHGMWDASQVDPPANPKLGDFYLIAVAGQVNGKPMAVGDMMIYDGQQWDRIDNQQMVTSVAGRTGAIALSVADVAGLQPALDAKVSSGSAASLSGLNVSGNITAAAGTFAGAVRSLAAHETARDDTGWLLRFVDSKGTTEYGGVQGNPGNYVSLAYGAKAGFRAWSDGSLGLGDNGVALRPDGLLDFGAGNGGIGKGNGDNATNTTANVQLKSWFGIGLSPTITGQPVPAGENAHWFNVRNGDMTCRGNISAWGGIRLAANGGEGRINLGVDDWYNYGNGTSWGMYSPTQGMGLEFRKSDKRLMVSGNLSVSGDDNFGMWKNGQDNCLVLKGFQDLRFQRKSDNAYVQIWNGANFDPNSKLNVSGGNVGGPLVTVAGNDGFLIKNGSEYTGLMLFNSGESGLWDYARGTYRLLTYANGDAYIRAWFYAANFKITSDARLKSNRQLLDAREELDKLKRLLPSAYDKDGKREYGFLAQEVEEVYPSMISTFDGPAGPDTKAASYTELLAPVIAVLVDLDRRLKEAGI